MAIKLAPTIFFVWPINPLSLFLRPNDDNKTYNYYQEAFREREG